jgi:hypothetical protein
MEVIKRASIIGLLLVVCTYYLAAIYILRFSLDEFVLPPTDDNDIKLPPPYLLVSNSGNELLIRRYGNTKNRCVIFFPGQHGGIARYQSDLFPSLVRHGISVFAVSYPGQDGAKGHGRLSELPGLIETGLTRLESVCDARESVFIGRSLGSMVAVDQAVHWRPRGVVVDGISPSLADAIYTYMENHWYLRPACVLPIQKILRRHYVLGDALDELGSTKVIVFQGSSDVRTPLSLAKRAVAGRDNVRFVKVAGAAHSNSYLKAFSQYIGSVITLLDAKPNNPIKPPLSSLRRVRAACGRRYVATD